MTFLEDTLEAGGRVGRDLAAVDWSRTPLGDPETWHASLRSAIRIVLSSKFSMWMAWGPELTFFCNDAYRRDSLGNKYPWALGRPASEVWEEIWTDIGPRIEHVLRTGEATWDESLRLLLERSGYKEETYHTFSYSPLPDDDGQVAGMLCVVKEDTAQVISTRRMATLRDLGARVTGLDETASIQEACRRLSGNPRSLPFALVYINDHDTGLAHRAGTSGIRPGHPAAPDFIDTADPDAVWPAHRALAGETVRVTDLQDRFPTLPTGAWDDPPTTAMVLPLQQPAQTLPYGFLVTALNPYGGSHDTFEGFVTLISAQLASIITDARAYEFERARADALALVDQVKTDFFTNVSHELRTPLTLLLGPAEEALADTRQPLPDVQRERVAVMQRNARRLHNLVNSLLDFSRLEAGTATAHFRAVDLARYTTELASMFESAAVRAGLSLTIDCPPLPEPVYVDQDHWSKIVLNLISNALKFTFEGGITVGLRADGEVAVLTVSDTGTGVPAADLPLLFERFHRVRGARTRAHEGSGIGLALVAELTEMHGGEVAADSTPEVGSTFSVRIPFGTDHLPEDRIGTEDDPVDVSGQAQGYVADTLRWLDRSGDAAAALPAPAGPDADAAHILVVDDNEDMRRYVADLLRPTYRVETAVDGLDALAKVAESGPDLVLTDVMMPNLDGFGLLERLHSEPTSTGIPVIMLSARAGEDGVIEGLEAGADDYLIKPFSRRELLARVAVNLELDRARRVREALERSQDLLDQAQRLAKVGSWEADLDADLLRGSEEFHRILGLDASQLAERGHRQVLRDVVHPDDYERVDRTLREAEPGSVARWEVRLRTSDGQEKTVQVWSEVVPDATRRVLRGSVQDVTEQRELERAVAAAAAREEAAAREHAIAAYLQRSLLPEQTYLLEQLEVATYYRSGVEGTEVGGDWYDVIELGAGRVALVVGDVMGRGVRAASVMGQLRSSVRALAKLDLTPGEVIEQLDGFVRELGAFQMVTCVFAIFDSADQTMRYANAGHVPPMVRTAGGETLWLMANSAPLGAGSGHVESLEVQLTADARVLFYTDGLVEQRGEDLDSGLQALEREFKARADTPVSEVPELLIGLLRPDGTDDDVALLVTRVNADPFHAAVSRRLGEDTSMVADARRLVVDHLRSWSMPETLVDDMALTANELVSNALMHGAPPVDLRLVHTGSHVVLEVHDRSPQRPHSRVPEATDEHGRGLQMVAALSTAWGTRIGADRKTVWASRVVPVTPPNGG